MRPTRTLTHPPETWRLWAEVVEASGGTWLPLHRHVRLKGPSEADKPTRVKVVIRLPFGLG
jgi:hypothetical protein